MLKLKLQQIIFLLLICSLANGQSPITGRSFDLKAPISDQSLWGKTLEYQAKDNIKLSTGFNSLHTYYNFKINESLVVDAKYLQPSEIVNPSTRDITQNTTVTGVTGMSAIDDKGAANYTIPIDVPPGTNGLQPQLSISYNSQGGVGNLGIGWYVNCENAITRTFQGGAITLTNLDNYALNGNKLVNLNSNAIGDGNTSSDDHVNTGDNTFTTEVPTFSKIIAVGSNNNGTPTRFIVKNSDGSVMYYGLTDNAKLMVKNGSNVNTPLIWCLSKATDAHQNSMEYEYYCEGGRIYLKKIKYCKAGTTDYINEVQFCYDQFDTPLIKVIGNNTLKQNVILNKIKVVSSGNVVNEYTFDYLSGSHPKLSAVNRTIQGQKLNACLIQWGDIHSIGNDIPTDIKRGTFRYVADFNGDGLDDILCLDNFNIAPIVNGPENDQRGPDNLSLYLSLKDANGSVSLHKTSSIPVNPRTRKGILVINTPIGCDNIYENYSYLADVIIVGNFNNDNKADLVIGRADATNKTITFEKYLGQDGNEVGLKKEITCDIPPLFYDLPGSVEDYTKCSTYFPLPSYDYDGDGITDVSLFSTNIDNEQNEIIHFSKAGVFVQLKSSFKPYASDNHLITSRCLYGTPVKIVPEISFNLSTTRAGNLLSNSITAIVTYSSDDGAFLIKQWNGTSFETKARAPYLLNSTSNFSISDCNGDGIDDILIDNGDIIYSDGYGPTFTMTGKFSEIGHFINDMASTTVSAVDLDGDGINEAYGSSRLATEILGDFNGDGVLDRLIEKSNPGNVTIRYNDNVSDVYRTKTVTDGFGNGSTFEYKPITEVASYYNNSYTQLPVFVGNSYEVTSLITTPKGLTAKTISNTYESPYCDRSGENQKGFLGFKKVTTDDDAALTRTTKVYEYEKIWDDGKRTYLAPQLSSVTIHDITNPLSLKFLGSTTNYWDVTETFEQSKTSVNLYLAKTEVLDFFLGKTTTEYCKPNKYGQQEPTAGSFSVQTQKGTSVTETKVFSFYDSDNTNEVWKIRKIKSSSITKKHEDDGTNSYNITYDYNYSNDGTDLWQVVVNRTKTGEYISDEYTYKADGNLKSHAKGVRVITYDYDTYGRFITETSDINGDKVTNISDLWGNVLSAKSSITNLTTTNTYDLCGRLIRTDNPDGSYSTKTVAWSGTIGQPLIKNTQTSSDGSQTITETNCAGQTMRKQSADYANKWIVVDKTYYPSGLLKTESLPYSLVGGTKEDITYTYKNGMIFEKKGKGVDLTYEYLASSSGHDVKVTDNLTNLITTTSYNVAGQITKAVEPSPANTIIYKYNAMGEPKFIDPTNKNVSGANSVNFYYDDLGRRIGITDPSLGTFVDAATGNTLSVKYSYNQWGELVDKKDAKTSPNLCHVDYNNLGQVTNETNTQGTQKITKTYNYYQSGVNKNRLSDVTSSNGTPLKDVKYSYTYDVYGNVLNKTENIEGTDYKFDYTFDTENRVSTMKYPTGLTLKYTYENGFLKKINDNADNTEYWSFSGMDDKGHYTQTKKGGKYSTEYKYDSNYLLNEIITKDENSAVIQDLGYLFDANTNNLTNRVKGSLTETFLYDNTDRLTTSTITKTGSDPIISNTGYSASNSPAVIKSKTGFTSITYGNNGNPYQVDNVTTDDAVLTAQNALTSITAQHTITYTPFNKVATISDDTNNRLLSINYGPDNSRKVAELTTSGNKIIKRVYLDGFEIENTYNADGSVKVSRQLCYINAPTGIVAVVEKKGTATPTVNYVFTDHLGSWNLIVDGSGSKTEMSFDAWGNRRNTASWANDASIRGNFYRGFTGHEHWDDLGLIDMNGRIYDPVLGMFISIDPNIQDPTNSQNFNRYTYCLNNPLKYTDPTGEFWNLIIGAVIGGIVNWATHGAEFSWEGLGYFGIGAAAGALGAGIGGGISSAIAGGSFGSGFMGTFAACTATSSFISGAAIGGGAGLSSGFIAGTGNGLMGGQKFGNALKSGVRDGIIGGVTGGLIGGFVGGIDAAIQGRRFIDGATVQDVSVVHQEIPIIGQRGDNNCLPTSAEAVDKSFGGNMTQEDIRNLVSPNSNPITDPLGDVTVWNTYTSKAGHTWSGDVGKPTSWARIIGDMSRGDRVAISLNTGSTVGHSVVMQSVVQRTITKVSGKVIQKYLYYIMNPGNGGSIERLSTNSISHATNIFFISR